MLAGWGGPSSQEFGRVLEQYPGYNCTSSCPQFALPTVSAYLPSLSPECLGVHVSLFCFLGSWLRCIPKMVGDEDWRESLASAARAVIDDNLSASGGVVNRIHGGGTGDGRRGRDGRKHYTVYPNTPRHGHHVYVDSAGTVTEVTK